MPSSSNPEVAIFLRVRDEATAHIQKLDGELRKLGGAGASLGAQLKSAADSVAGFTTVAAAAGVAGLAAGFGAAIKTASDFESQMSAISAVAGASASEMAALQQAALDLGASTSFSAKEAAQGIEELVKAGVSVENVLAGGAKGALDLAAAGAISVAEAAEIASNAMNAFGLTGSDMGRIADLIAGAANSSAIGVNDFKFSLSAAGAVAATVGVSFEDLATGIALMGNAGIKGSDAGTSLKTMLLSLASPTKEARNVLRELGVITADGANQFFTAEGRIKSLAEVSGVLQEATRHLTDQQKLQALQTIFGTDAIRAAAVMANAGAEGFTTLAAAIGKVTADEVSRERLNNFAGSLEQLKGALETASIIVGKAFLPALKELTEAATEIVQEALPGLQSFAEQAATTFRSWIPAIKEGVAALWENRTAIAQVLAAIAGFAVFVTAASWVATLAAAFSPLGIAIMAIAGAAALLGTAWVQNWGGIQEKTAAVWAALQPVLTELTTWLSEKVGQALAWLSTTGWPAFLAAATAAATFIGGTLIPGIAALAEHLGPLLQPAIEWISGTGWPGMVEAGTKLYDTGVKIVTFVRDLLAELERRGVFDDLARMWRSLNELGAVLWPIIQNLYAAWKLWWEIVDRFVVGPARLILKWLLDMTSSAPSTASTVERIASAIQNVTRAIDTAIRSATEFLRLLRSFESIRIPIPSLSSLPGRANGGPVSAGHPYIVGERGPEFFVPASSGRIETLQDIGTLLAARGGSSAVAAGVGVTYVTNVNGAGLHEVAGEVVRRIQEHDYLRGVR
jgi:TP901 family phage tail tape measure protein